jgi:hypothetical protein
VKGEFASFASEEHGTVNPLVPRRFFAWKGIKVIRMQSRQLCAQIFERSPKASCE